MGFPGDDLITLATLPGPLYSGSDVSISSGTEESGSCRCLSRNLAGHEGRRAKLRFHVTPKRTFLTDVHFAERT